MSNTLVLQIHQQMIFDFKNILGTQKLKILLGFDGLRMSLMAIRWLNYVLLFENARLLNLQPERPISPLNYFGVCVLYCVAPAQNWSHAHI